MKRIGQSLFSKYYLAVSTGIVAIFVVLSVVVMLFVSDYLTDATTKRLENNTVEIAHIIERDGMFVDDLSVLQAISLQNTMGIFSQANDSDIIIVSKKGNVVLSSGVFSNYIGNKLPEKMLKSIVKSATTGEHYKFKETPKRGETTVIISSAISTGGYVVAASQLDTLSQYKSDIARILLLCVFFALTVSVAVVYFLSSRTLKPLKQLSFATKKIASGDYSYRVEVTGDDEFQELGDAFNDMARSLSELEESRRSFIANISHELKTPMTTIAGFVDGIVDGTIPKDQQNKYLSVVSSEVKRLSRLVVAMLDLSKIEAGELTLKREQVDTSQMVFDILLSFEQLISKKNIEIRGLDVMKKQVIPVDRDMIYQVFYNLIDNAVKFTTDGGYIAVAAIEQDGKFIFRIKNKCEGISKDDLSRVFERFYKGDKSHSREVKGVGLGLYLVKTIVEMHGGQITVLSEQGENCEFLFWVPTDFGGA